MTFRSDVPVVEISLAHFQEFDHGAEVQETVAPAILGLESGDQLYWGCAQFEGIARVVRCVLSSQERVAQESILTLVKVG